MAFKAFDLTGKVALITGGNGGIGLGMGKAIAEAGGDVCIWGTNETKNAAAVEELKAFGTRVSSLSCNVADQKEVQDCFAETLSQYGRVDGCFANAGVTSGKRSFLEIDDADWQRVIGVNLDGAFYTLQEATKHMVERAENGDPGGRLVGTASLAAISGAARNEHYAATKGGLISMLRAMSVEFAGKGITANAILPGWIETAMTEPAFNWNKFSDNVKPRIPAKRWGNPEDFGGIAVYIMSDASSYHTGDTFLIDGGYFLF
ncbi:MULTISPECIES: SDR family NAD(P)-dependent oxidoreductase [Sneathiella]|jgi:NAD(P)-dependent dehydrogenase (short-subunit alcohol dehydrogenase family)|uniref:SDR family NAD(P)-dependent oxidoreductase n=1 Tax=Sneathiella TaxID=510690 RepID=UPI00146A10DA|nr:SDR family NAD(P)-dependent oxidoreductase [Sneathiella aquimaris]